MLWIDILCFVTDLVYFRSVCCLLSTTICSRLLFYPCLVMFVNTSVEVLYLL